MVGASIGYAGYAGTDGEALGAGTVCINFGPGLYVGASGELKVGLTTAGGTSQSVYGDSVSFNGDVGFHGSTGFDVSVGLDSNTSLPNSATNTFNPKLKGAAGVGYGAQISVGYCFTPDTNKQISCDKTPQ